MNAHVHHGLNPSRNGALLMAGNSSFISLSLLEASEVSAFTCKSLNFGILFTKLQQQRGTPFAQAHHSFYIIDNKGIFNYSCSPDLIFSEFADDEIFPLLTHSYSLFHSPASPFLISLFLLSLPPSLKCNPLSLLCQLL